MPDSKRQQIIDKVLERMITIRTANGYQTNLGLAVRDWETNWDEKELPALSVCDLDEKSLMPNESADAPRQIRQLPVGLKIFTQSDTPAREIRKLIADVEKAIKVDLRWTSLAMHTVPQRSGMVVSEEAFEIAGAAVEIEIVYMTDTFDSYN
jgi:hypothetical protein